MIHRNGGEKGEPLTLPVGGNGRLYGITSVGEYCPRGKIKNDKSCYSLSIGYIYLFLFLFTHNG